MKALLFCDSREDVEVIATAIGQLAEVVDSTDVRYEDYVYIVEIQFDPLENQDFDADEFVDWVIDAAENQHIEFYGIYDFGRWEV